MLITASGYIRPGFLLLTLGHSCHYGLVVTTPVPSSATPSLVLFDPGSSVHLESLSERLPTYHLSLSNVSYILITNLNSERMGSIPYLRQRSPGLRVIGSGALQRAISEQSVINELYQKDCAWRARLPHLVTAPALSFEEFSQACTIDFCVSESEVLDISETISIRVIPAPGHSVHSLSYLIEPYRFLVADQVVGYYRGRALAGSGADEDLALSITTLEKIDRLEIDGLCFPYYGVLVGQLVRKHIHDLLQNTRDLINESDKAIKQGIALDHVRSSIHDSFYTSDSRDPFFMSALGQSFESVWKQLSGGGLTN